MLKRTNKKLALLLVLTMLATMFVGVGAASAAQEYAVIDSSYTYVEAEDAQPAGVIDITMGEDYVAANLSDIYVEVTLPEGVEFTDTATLDLNNGDDTLVLLGAAAEGVDSALFYYNAVPGAVDDVAEIAAIDLDIDSDVTGSIKAEVRVWGVNGDSIVWDITDDVTIAKVAAGDVTVSVASAKALTPGAGKTGAKITIKETSPGALSTTNGGDIFLTVKATGVKWDTTMGAPVTSGITLDAIDADDDYSNNDKTLHLTVDTASTIVNGKIEITPKLIVEPSASGEVIIQVKGDDIDTTDVVVGNAGTAGIVVTVEKDDKDKVYAGRTADFEHVKITLDADTIWRIGDYFTMTLPAGVKWQDVAAPIDDSIDDVDILKFAGLYNNDQTAWFSVTGATIGDDIELTDLQILADYNAVPGDLEVTFGAKVTGTYKIGTVAQQFTVAADPLNLPVNTADIPGNTITITETAAGAILATDNDDDDADAPDALDIVLPMGVVFAGVPDVDVVDGDLEIGDVEVVDDDTLRIQIEAKSNLASVIEITDITYSVDNRAAAGDINAKVGKELNMNSTNPLATFKIGKIVSATSVPASSFVIGATTYTIDGVEYTMDVAPFISGDRTFMPIRYVAYALGVSEANVLWDGASQTVTLMKGDKIVQIKVGSTQLLVNGAAITMDVAPVNVNGRVCLPIRFVAQAFGATVGWDGATQTVTID